MNNTTSNNLTSKKSSTLLDLLILSLLLVFYPLGLIVMWIKRPWRQFWHWFWTLLPVGFILFIILLAAVLPEVEEPTTELQREERKELTYDILKTTDTSNGMRKRLKVWIHSNAETKAERETVLRHVAKEQLEQRGMGIVFVYLDPIPDFPDLINTLGMAVYCPDQLGIEGPLNKKLGMKVEKVPVWRVDAVSKVLTEREKEILRVWFSNDLKFRDDLGIIQRDKLSAFVASELGIPIEEFKFPTWEFHQVWLR